MKCPKCDNKNILIWYSGGRYKAQCQSCLWHGLQKSLKLEGEKLPNQSPLSQENP